jgi:hypothetical protein
MLFNSTQFLFLFLPVVLVVYYRLSHTNQNRFLLIASAVKQSHNAESTY